MWYRAVVTDYNMSICLVLVLNDEDDVIISDAGSRVNGR